MTIIIEKNIIIEDSGKWGRYTAMSFEEFKKFITAYYPEDCYDDDVIRDFYDKGYGGREYLDNF